MNQAMAFRRLNEAKTKLEAVGLQLKTGQEVFSITNGKEDDKDFIWVNATTVEEIEAFIEGIRVARRIDPKLLPQISD